MHAMLASNVATVVRFLCFCLCRNLSSGTIISNTCVSAELRLESVPFAKDKIKIVLSKLSTIPPLN